MKKTFAILSIILLGAVGCTKNVFETPAKEGGESDGMVEITMTMDVPNELLASTKAGEWGHTPSIDDIRVAMFGTSGYTQAYTKAVPDGSVATTNYDESPGGNTTKYKFKVLLPVYEGEVHIHVIANGDKSVTYDGWPENKLMSRMTTEGGVGAYWARITLEDGILPQWDSNGTMRVVDGHFVPTTETKAAFQDIVLIRNFAEVKLILEDAVKEKLTDVTYTVINVPTSGSVAPIYGTSLSKHAKSATDTTTIYEATYVDDYDSYQMDATTSRMKKVTGEETETYPGYMVNPSVNSILPTKTEINTDLPADGVALPYTESKPAFVYERPFSEQDPPMIIMRGKWSDGKYYYYRLDMMDENLSAATSSAYFPLYRNYQYQIRISKIGNKGADSPTAAMARNWGGNISMTAGTQKLADISDGESRLYVKYVDHTYIDGGEKTDFYVKYEPAADGTVDNSKITFPFTFKKDADGNDMNNALIPLNDPVPEGGTPIWFEKTTGTDSDKQYYKFKLKEPGAETLETTFIVSASNGETGDAASTLQREITVRIIRETNMSLSFNPVKAGWSAGSKVVLNIELDGPVNESMFPLEFKIEDSAHILNPTGKDKDGGKDIEVPVKTDESLIDGSNSFYFIRTVNWSEYKPLAAAYEAGDPHAIVFSTEFKTLEDAKETQVHVDNEYFDKKDIKLERAEGTLKTATAIFSYEDFSTSKPSATDGHVTITFNNIYSTYNGGVQIRNDNSTATMTVKALSTQSLITGLSMNFTGANYGRGNIAASVSAMTTYSTTAPYTRSWPTNNTSTTDNLVLTFTPYTTGGGWLSQTYYHRISSITVSYQYYE